MGHASSSAREPNNRGQPDDVKRQVDSDVSKRRAIYQLVDVKTGGGKLIELVKQSARRKSLSAGATSASSTLNSTRSFETIAWASSSRSKQGDGEHGDKELDEQIKALVEPLLYEQGRGKMIPLRQLWRLRFNLQDDSQAAEPDHSKPESELEGDQNSSESRRLVCWRLEERGFVGETALHICFLLSTPSHMILAQKLLELYPMLIYDVYTCDEYFGESCLHMAIVNENIRIVKWLLARGAQVHQRCLGSFFLPLDQREARGTNGRARRWLSDDSTQSTTDHNNSNNPSEVPKQSEPDWLANEFVSTSTNYEGHCYWGEYPLSFAASLGLADCYRLLLAYGADPNRCDSNGNSTLHICVIVDRIDMFDLCFANGAQLERPNKQRLTPLALAAKLERVKMFFHILSIRRESSWMLCQVCFQQVSLAGLDSIDSRDGSIDDNSLLCIVVSGSSNAHLSMLDGLLAELLQVKWQTSIEAKFSTYFASYLLFLCVASLAYLARIADHHQPVGSLKLHASHLRWRTNLRALAELTLILLVLCYLLLLAKRLAEPAAHSPGARRRARELLGQAPEIGMFTVTCLLVLACVPLRLARLDELESSLAATIIFLLPLKLLFFCRASRSLGSFIVMIYRILVNDVLCFVVFLIIFVAGFSQSFFIIFQTHSSLREAPDSCQQTGQTLKSSDSSKVNQNYFANLFDALISMHMMALNEFSLVLDQFDATDFPLLARLLFCLYMILVSILLVNMLIAMLGKTYQDISSQPNESLRQWARALLAVERMCSPASRLKMLDEYSHSSGGAQVGTEQNSEKRVYNSTIAMSEQQVAELRSVEQLIEENRVNLTRAAKRALRASLA